jgi:phage terminase large subunit GpA-like protein
MRMQKTAIRAAQLWRLPPKLTASEWCDRHYYLSPESSGTEAPWRTLPNQRAILNCIGGDYCRDVTLLKCARVGYTKMLVGGAAYLIAYKRRTGAIWQPVDGDATEFKKDEINPALRDVRALRERMLARDPEQKSKHNTEDRVAFDGATLYVRGAKAAKNFRRLTLDFAFLDEYSAWQPDIDGEGSGDALAAVRLTASPYPKRVLGSTPKEANTDLTERTLGDARLVFHRELPCPECGEFHRLEWKNFHYDKADPHKTARFKCPWCADEYAYSKFAEIDELGRWATAGGEWIDEPNERVLSADGEPVEWPGHVGFFIWAAHSYIQSWGRLAEIWIEANDEKKRTGDDRKLKTFVNTQLAETWREIEQQISTDQLFARREQYAAEVPADGLVLTAGVDTQDDRLEMEVVAWGANGESWGIEYKVLHGDPANNDVWSQLDQALEQTYQHEHGSSMRIVAVGIDSGGHRTRQVYEYCRTRHARRVYCLKGQGGEGVPVHRAPSNVKVRGSLTVKLYSIGVDALKAGWIAALQRVPGQFGYVHIPDSYSLEWCEQALGEAFVNKFDRGRLTRRWIKLRARVEALDCRNYARAAVEILNPLWEKLHEQLEATHAREEKNEAEAAAKKQKPARRRKNNFVNRW